MIIIHARAEQAKIKKILRFAPIDGAWRWNNFVAGYHEHLKPPPSPGPEYRSSGRESAIRYADTHAPSGSDRGPNKFFFGEPHPARDSSQLIDVKCIINNGDFTFVVHPLVWYAEHTLPHTNADNSLDVVRLVLSDFVIFPASQTTFDREWLTTMVGVLCGFSEKGFYLPHRRKHSRHPGRLSPGRACSSTAPFPITAFIIDTFKNGRVGDKTTF